MTKLVAVSKERHGNSFWKRPDSYAFAASQHMAPILVAEVFRAALAMPLAFIQKGQNYLLVGLLSLSSGKNFLVAPNGKWVGDHIPLVFRSYPFRLARADGRDEMILCVDEDSNLLNKKKSGGEPFFDDSGKMSNQLQEVANFLNLMEKSRKVADVAVGELAKAGLIKPWTLKIGDEKIEGLHRIDQEMLQQVEDGIFLNLRKTGALIVAYGQLLSMGNIRLLQKLAMLRGKLSPEPKPAVLASNDGEFIRFVE